jgi:hypothetical protein
VTERRLYIAGTGRAGTTFLVRYLTALGLDTTLSRNPLMVDDERANAGIEEGTERLDQADLPYVVKTPWLYLVIDELLEKGTFHADAVIIPVRDLKEAAISRLTIEHQSIIESSPEVCTMRDPWNVWGRVPGGALYSMHPIDEERLLAVGFHHLVERLVRADVPIVFLHFPRFVMDGEYLHSSLAPTLGHVTAEMARAAFAQTADPQKVRTTVEVSSVAATSTSDIALLQHQNAALKRENRALRSRAWSSRSLLGSAKRKVTRTVELLIPRRDRDVHVARERGRAPD